jgi:multiple sugar transport system ATP-binding protein
MPVEAHLIEPPGSDDIVDLKMGPGFLRARTRAGLVPGLVPGPGTQVWVRAEADRAHFFDSGSGQSLGVRL